MAKLTIRLKGSPSSGNFGHAGRPGKVGGSAPGKRVIGKKPLELSTKVQAGSGKIAEKLRAEVEANFPKGDRLGYALGAIGDAYVGTVVTTRDNSGKLVGIATLLRDPSNKQNPISISYIATAQKGVGKGMMDKIKGITRKDSTTLYAEPSTKGATAFFKKMGFELSETTGSVGEFMVWKP